MAASAGTLRAGPIPVGSRALGTFLIGYGICGLVIAASLLVALGPADLAGLGRIDAERQAVVELLAGGETTALDSQAAVERAQASVAAGADAADESAAFARQLASALRQFGTALRVDLLGSRPFESAAGDVEGAADRAEAAAGRLDRAGAEGRSGAEGIGSLAADLQRASTELAAVREGLTGTGGVGVSLTWVRVALIGLVLWLAVPAVASLWLGARLRRTSPNGSRPRS
jgi:hypothetical protein